MSFPKGTLSKMHHEEQVPLQAKISRRRSQPEAHFSTISSSEALHEMSFDIRQHPCLLVSREHASLIFCLPAVLIWLIAPRLHSHQLVELLAVSLIAEGGSIPPVGPKSSTCLLQCRQLVHARLSQQFHLPCSDLYLSDASLLRNKGKCFELVEEAVV